VRRLVRGEPDVPVRPEHLAGAELRLQRGQQGQHRAAHRRLVTGLVLLPVGPRVVRLEPFVEVERLFRKAPASAGLLAHPGSSSSDTCSSWEPCSSWETCSSSDTCSSSETCSRTSVTVAPSASSVRAYPSGSQPAEV